MLSAPLLSKTFIPGPQNNNLLIRANVMSLTSWFRVEIEATDYNAIHRDTHLLSTLRNLTLGYYSGMNYELTAFEQLIKERPVDCNILLARRYDKIVAWAIVSNESSEYSYFMDIRGFSAKDCSLFEVYVDPLFRRCGIGKKLFETAKNLANGKKLCVCPHDNESQKFFGLSYGPQFVETTTNTEI